MLYLFSTSAGEVLTIAATLAAALPLPLLPAQIIWLNLVTDTFLDVSLAMEPKPANLLSGRGTQTARLFDPLMRTRLLLMAATMAIGTLLVFFTAVTYDMPMAFTLALTTLAAFQWFNAWNARSETESVFATNPLKNPALIAATCLVIALHVAALNLPFLQRILHTIPLSPMQWLLCISVASSILVVEEIRKYFSCTRATA